MQFKFSVNIITGEYTVCINELERQDIKSISLEIC